MSNQILLWFFVTSKICIVKLNFIGHNKHLTVVSVCAAGIKPEDVGLKPDMPYFNNKNAGRTPKITYLHIYECEKFSVNKLSFKPLSNCAGFLMCKCELIFLNLIIYLYVLFSDGYILLATWWSYSSSQSPWNDSI